MKKQRKLATGLLVLEGVALPVIAEAMLAPFSNSDFAIAIAA